MMRLMHWPHGLLLGCMLLPALFASAATTVNYSGTLSNEPPCKFVDEQPIEVSFGDVQISEVDGKQHVRDIYIPVQCKDGAAAYLKHIGRATSFDTAAIQTNVADFGIQLSVVTLSSGNYIPFAVGSTVEISNNVGSLVGLVVKAVPVKKSGVKLTTGEFNGISTLEFVVP